MAIAAAGAKLPNPWEVVGRGTEVGRALFALYNGYGVARNRGNKYSDHNRMKIMERISAKGLPDLEYIPIDSLKAKKPFVKVPHFRKKYVSIDEIPQVLLMRGRRKSSYILSQLKEEMSQKDQPPQPKRPLLDEKEKARLQEIFEWSGRDVEDINDETKSEVPMVPKKPAPPRGSVEEQEMLIEAIAKEIEERKQFLDKMFELGRGPKYEAIIRLEIQERIRQIELLDKNISSMDKERLEGWTHQSNKSSTQSKHAHMVEQERTYSRASSLSSNRNFKEQLDVVRKETMALKGDTCSKSMQGGDNDEFDDIEGDISCSEKSFSGQSASSINNAKSGYKMKSGPHQLQAPPSVQTIEELRSLHSLSQHDDNDDDDDERSIANTHLSNCSSDQSGNIRSGLESIKSMSNGFGANSSHQSIVSMQ